MSGSGRELFFSDAGAGADDSSLPDERDPLSLFMSFDDDYFCEAVGSQSSSFTELDPEKLNSTTDVAAPSSPVSSSSLEAKNKAAAGEAAAALDDDDKSKKVR